MFAVAGIYWRPDQHLQLAESFGAISQLPLLVYLLHLRSAAADQRFRRPRRHRRQAQLLHQDRVRLQGRLDLVLHHRPHHLFHLLHLLKCKLRCVIYYHNMFKSFPNFVHLYSSTYCSASVWKAFLKLSNALKHNKLMPFPHLSNCGNIL